MRIRLSLLVPLLPLSIGWSQGIQDTLNISPRSDSLYLNVIIPEKDTTTTGASRQRFAANTNPTAKAFLNGTEVRVYLSGAFVGLLSLAVGDNPLNIVVVSPKGDSLVRNFTLSRTEPAKNSSRDTLTIDSIMMEPSEDLWLGDGDIVEVRFKGSPGYEATFDIDGVESGIPMREMPPKEAGGFQGVYVGRYVIRHDDEARKAAISFKLRKSFWSSERATAMGSVTITPGELPRVAEVTGRRPFLNVGRGSDRLGGAKLGYLQPGVRVVVGGKTGAQYRVKLSESMEGWLPEGFANLLPSETPLPQSLVGSISVYGSSSEDIVTVGLSQRLPYSSEQQVNPAAVVVDLYGATSNTNWITQHLSATGIQNVSWDQVGAAHYRLTILLSNPHHWGYEIGYDNGSNLRVKVRRPPLIASADSVLKGMTVVVDAGHGGENEGALGATGAREMDVTLSIANHLARVLAEKGARSIMTRSDSSGWTMTDRTEKILTSDARLLVSIHCNSVGFTTDPEKVKGTATFFRYAGFKPLANAVYAKMLELGFEQFGVVGSFNFALNAPTELPNVLVETAFLSNPEDEMKLIDDAFQRRMAEKIAEGLETFIKTAGSFPQPSN